MDQHPAQLRRRLDLFLCVYFCGGLECVGHSFNYVATFVFLTDVWIRNQRAAVSSRRANNLATHLVNLVTHLGLIRAVMERSIPPDLGGVAQLRFFGDSSYLYIVNVHKRLPPAGAITLADS
jgi:hypothetical protein